MADTFWVGPEADPEAPDAVHALVRQPLCQTGDAGSALPGLCRIAGAACTNLQTCNRKRGMQGRPNVQDPCMSLTGAQHLRDFCRAQMRRCTQVPQVRC